MPLLLALLFFGVILGLAYANWKLWRGPITVWRIPKSEIKREAEALQRDLGFDQARQTVRRRAVEAWCRQDLIEHGKWERVARCLDKAGKERQL